MRKPLIEDLGSNGFTSAAVIATGRSIASWVVDDFVLIARTRFVPASRQMVWSATEAGDRMTEKFPVFDSVAVSSHFEASSADKR